MPRHSAKVFCWQLHTLYTEGGGRRNKISAVLFKTYCILQVCPTEWTSLAPPIANNSAKLLLFTLQCYINYQLEYANIHSGPSPTDLVTPQLHTLWSLPHTSIPPLLYHLHPCTTKNWYYLTQVGPCEITSNTSDTFC